MNNNKKYKSDINWSEFLSGVTTDLPSEKLETLEEATSGDEGATKKVTNVSDLAVNNLIFKQGDLFETTEEIYKKAVKEYKKSANFDRLAELLNSCYSLVDADTGENITENTTKIKMLSGIQDPALGDFEELDSILVNEVLAPVAVDAPEKFDPEWLANLITSPNSVFSCVLFPDGSRVEDYLFVGKANALDKELYDTVDAYIIVPVARVQSWTLPEGYSTAKEFLNAFPENDYFLASGSSSTIIAPGTPIELQSKVIELLDAGAATEEDVHLYDIKGNDKGVLALGEKVEIKTGEGGDEARKALFTINDLRLIDPNQLYTYPYEIVLNDLVGEENSASFEYVVNSVASGPYGDIFNPNSMPQDQWPGFVFSKFAPLPTLVLKGFRSGIPYLNEWNQGSLQGSHAFYFFLEDYSYPQGSKDPTYTFEKGRWYICRTTGGGEAPFEVTGAYSLEEMAESHEADSHGISTEVPGSYPFTMEEKSTVQV